MLPMLSAAERNALILTLAFLLSGAGIKLWIRSRVELGPFTDTSLPHGPGVAEGAAPADTAAASPDSVAVLSGPEKGHPGPEPMASAWAPSYPEGGEPVAAPAEKPARRPAGRAPGRKAAPAKSAPAEPIDVNRAGPDELAGIPGIGPATALAIVAFRKERGGILEIGELLQVKGIGAKKLERIAPWLKAIRPVVEDLPRQAASQSP